MSLPLIPQFYDFIDEAITIRAWPAFWRTISCEVVLTARGNELCPVSCQNPLKSLHKWKWVRIGFAALGGAIFLGLGWLNLTQQSFYRDDESFYRRALEGGPSNALVMDFLGDYYMSQKQPDRALKQFTLAKQFAPDNPEVTFALAKGLFETGKYSDAEPFLKELSQSSKLPQGGRELSTLSLAQTEIRLGQFKEAEETLARLQAENFSYDLLHDTLGALYQSEGRLLDAQREYFLEFSISGNVASRQKALRLTEFLRSQSTTAKSAPPSH